MGRQRTLMEVIVGLFLITGFAAFLFLTFKVSGLTQFAERDGFYVHADFHHIGSLKVRAPVSIAGVKVGEVVSIHLKPEDFVATVTMKLDGEQSQIPLHDTTARILTEGLLGSNYISIVPGFEDDEGMATEYLQNNSRLERTQSALILENLIGQLLFNINKKDKNEED